MEYCGKIDGQIHLCGISLGGIIGLNYALDFPEKVKTLVLIGTFTDCEGDDDERDYDLGYEALRYMEENRDPELLEPFVCYVPTGHGMPHQTLLLGAMINFRYISNTIIIHPYTK